VTRRVTGRVTLGCRRRRGRAGLPRGRPHFGAVVRRCRGVGWCHDRPNLRCRWRGCRLGDRRLNRRCGGCARRDLGGANGLRDWLRGDLGRWLLRCVLVDRLWCVLGGRLRRRFGRRGGDLVAMNALHRHARRLRGARRYYHL